MNYDPIISNLARLARIEPNPAFVRRIRSSVAHPPVVRWFAMPRIALGVGFAAMIALISAIAPISFSNPGVAPALSADALNREFDNLSIAITLNELAYDYPSSRTITNAVAEIADTKTPHLNGDVLKSEELQIETAETGEQIDALIEQITN